MQGLLVLSLSRKSLFHYFQICNFPFSILRFTHSNAQSGQRSNQRRSAGWVQTVLKKWIQALDKGNGDYLLPTSCHVVELFTSHFLFLLSTELKYIFQALLPLGETYECLLAHETWIRLTNTIPRYGPWNPSMHNSLFSFFFLCWTERTPKI